MGRGDVDADCAIVVLVFFLLLVDVRSMLNCEIDG